MLYLDKFLKEIENDKNITLNEIKVPENEFKKQLTDFSLIEKEKIEIINTKTIYVEYKILETEIKKNIIKKEKYENINKKREEIKNSPDIKTEKKEIENDKNFIIGEIVIDIYNINKVILIINSFENYKRINNYEDNENNWKYENKKEIKDNIEIKINEKIIKFSNYHKFENEEKYKIEFSFKKNLTNFLYAFFCESLTNLHLSNFNTQNVGIYFIVVNY